MYMGKAKFDYQPLFGKNEPALIPSSSGRIKDRTRGTSEIEPRAKRSVHGLGREW